SGSGAAYDWYMETQAVRAAAAEAEVLSQAHAPGPICIPVAGHELTIFDQSLPMIAALVRDIESARQRVWVESYIFLDDVAGSSVAEALKERARSGVDVRVLYDAVGSQTTPSAFFRDMAEAGVQVHAFHTVWEALYRFSLLRVLNRRNHPKLVVIDDRVAYFGVLNLPH